MYVPIFLSFMMRKSIVFLYWGVKEKKLVAKWHQKCDILVSFLQPTQNWFYLVKAGFCIVILLMLILKFKHIHEVLLKLCLILFLFISLWILNWFQTSVLRWSQNDTKTLKWAPNHQNAIFFQKFLHTLALNIEPNQWEMKSHVFHL